VKSINLCIESIAHEWHADIERALERILLRILGRQPTQADAPRGRRVFVDLFGGKTAFGFVWDDRLVLMSGGIDFDPCLQYVSWWIKELA
jgi:hypothetical protein